MALDGTLKLYGYDDAGRLSSAQYAYESSKPARDKQALEQTGVTPANLLRYFASYDLDDVDRSLIDQAYALAGGTSRTGVRYTANAWAEQFGYDSAGNRSSVTNPWGTISNLYDADNRVRPDSLRAPVNLASSGLKPDSAAFKLTPPVASQLNRKSH